MLHNSQLYSIAVLRTIRNDTSQAIIERRYSEFYQLNRDLRKRFHTSWTASCSRRRLWRGTTSTSSSRSVAVPSNSSSRISSSMTRSALAQSSRNSSTTRTCGGRTTTWCSRTLRKRLRSCRMRFTCRRRWLVRSTRTLFGHRAQSLLSIYQDWESHSHVLGYAEKALADIGEDQTNPFLIPLIQTLIGVRWRLHKDKRDLEVRLSQYVKPGTWGRYANSWGFSYAEFVPPMKYDHALHWK